MRARKAATPSLRAVITAESFFPIFLVIAVTQQGLANSPVTSPSTLLQTYHDERITIPLLMKFLSSPQIIVRANNPATSLWRVLLFTASLFDAVSSM